MKAAGTRERHIERCRYIPRPEADRKTRLHKTGFIQTYKKRGDIVIINATVKSFVVPRNGWY